MTGGKINYYLTQKPFFFQSVLTNNEVNSYFFNICFFQFCF